MNDKILFLPMPGDIFLCRSHTKPKLNIFAQWTLRPRTRPLYSHIAVVTSEKTFFHAMPNTGVDYVGIHELLLKSEYKSIWKIFRNKELAAQIVQDDIKTEKKISEAAQYFYAQKFNYGFHLGELALKRRFRNRSFCSQLIHKIFSALNIETGIGKKIRHLCFLWTIKTRYVIQRSGWMSPIFMLIFCKTPS